MGITVGNVNFSITKILHFIQAQIKVAIKPYLFMSMHDY